VDAVLAVLTMLHAGGDLFRKGAVLHYDQMLETPTKSVVSYAALAFEGEA
jgi:hypothetical protein